MDYVKLSKKGAILVSNNSTKYIHTALTGKMDDVLRYPELSVKSLCYLMSPENLHSQTKKIPKKHFPCGYPVHYRKIPRTDYMF